MAAAEYAEGGFDQTDGIMSAEGELASPAQAQDVVAEVEASEPQLSGMSSSAAPPVDSVNNPSVGEASPEAGAGGEEREAKLYVDVNVANFGIKRIIVYEGDTVESLVADFVKRCPIDEFMVEKLKHLLQQQMDGVLERIDEDEEQKTDNSALTDPDEQEGAHEAQAAGLEEEASESQEMLETRPALNENNLNVEEDGEAITMSAGRFAEASQGELSPTGGQAQSQRLSEGGQGATAQ